MSSLAISMRSLIDRLYKCIKGSSKADYREFTTTCIHLARLIDLAVSRSHKAGIQQDVGIQQELTTLLKKICEQKENESFQPAIMVLLMSVKNAICFDWFTPAERNELLLMSKELLDFFTGVGVWNAVDTAEASQFISLIMPRFYPLLNLQSVIVALEAKTGYEAMVCDFYVLKKPSASEELRLFVIRKDNQDTSACLVNPNHVNFLVNGRGVEKRSLASLDTGPQMPTNVTGMLKIGTNLLQIVGDFPGPYLIAIALTATSSNVNSPLNLQIYNHAGVKPQTDDELIEGPSRVSLHCPISHKRITSPVKGSSCKHHQCFDYYSFMEINSRRPSWRCPYCNRHVSFPDLRLDLQMLKILKEVGNSAADVMVSDDGTWETLASEEGLDGSQPWRKDPKSLNNSGESSAEEGEICAENLRPNMIDLTNESDQQMEVESRQNRESEDRKPDLREINAVSGINAQASRENINQNNAAAYASQSMPFEVPGYVTIMPDGAQERQSNRETSRTPIAIQALPAQGSIPNFRARSRPNSQPNSPAQPTGPSYTSATHGSQPIINQRPLQVQLPSFVGIHEGQVLLNAAHQQFQQDTSSVPDLPPPPNTQQVNSQQGTDIRDLRYRVQQLQSRPAVSQQPVYGARGVSHPRSERQGLHQPISVQQPARQDSPTLLDSQLRQVRIPNQLHQLQQLQQGQMNLMSSSVSVPREDHASAGFLGLAEGVPLYNQLPSASVPSSGILRRQTSHNARMVPATSPHLHHNPLIISNAGVTRDQRWVTSDAVPAQGSDLAGLVTTEHNQRRMRGSITTATRSATVNVPIGQSHSVATNYAWLHNVSPQSTPNILQTANQPSRFSPGVSPLTSSDSPRQWALPRATNNPLGTSLQSIQTASTLVTDFDNWLETQNENPLPAAGSGGLFDLGDLGPL